jgi:hypothetical protein
MSLPLTLRPRFAGGRSIDENSLFRISPLLRVRGIDFGGIESRQSKATRGSRFAAMPLARHDEPVRVEVGDSTVSGSYLKPCTNLWKLTQQKPGEPAEEVGTWSDSLENTAYKGHPAIKRMQIANYSKKRVQLTFVSIFDPKTMESFSFDCSRSDNGDVRHADFRHETVTYRHTDSAGSKPEEATVKLRPPRLRFLRRDVWTFRFNPAAGGWLQCGDTGLRHQQDGRRLGPGSRQGTRDGRCRARKESGDVGCRDTNQALQTDEVVGHKRASLVIKGVLEVPKKKDGSGEIAAIVTYTMV